MTERATRRFADFTWKEFEDYVINLLARIYAGYGLQVHKTPYQNDGGKDGYAALRIGPTDDSGDLSALSFAFRLWAEVKKRSSVVDLDDIGGHLILAIDARVNKILFITDSTFTKRALRLCEEVGWRLGIGVSFLTGESLEALEEQYSNDNIGGQVHIPLSHVTPVERKPGAKVVVRSGFATSPEDDFSANHVDLRIGVGEVAYWICQVSGYAAARNTRVEVISDSSQSNLTIIPVTGTSLYLDGVESSHRITFALWSDQRGDFGFNDLGLRITVATEDLPIDQHIGGGRIRVQSSILSGSIPDSRKDLVEKIGQDIGRLQDDSAVRCCILEAPPGIGKSFLLNALRQNFLRSGIREIRLDGESHGRLNTVAQSILRQAFPLPPDLVLSAHPKAMHQWLDQAGVREVGRTDPTVDLANLLSGVGQSIDENTVTALIAASLINRSRNGTLVVSYEDLHKANASVIDLIQRVLTYISFQKRGAVYFILTTRPHSQDEAKDSSAQFIQAMRSLERTSVPRAHYHIEPLTRTDARDLLQRSLRGLSHTEADHIIEQVGRNPFRLREALLYLHTVGAIEIGSDVGPFVLRPEGIDSVLESRVLLTATSERIKILVSREGEDLGLFLLAAACLGKVFASRLAAVGLNNEADWTHLTRLVALSENYELLKPTRASHATGQLDLSFDHDLVREALLSNASQSEIQGLARRLLPTVRSVGPPQLRLSISFLAGAADECASVASALLSAAQQGRDYAEALQFSLIRLLLLVEANNTFSAGAFLKPYLTALDRALTFVDPPKLPQRSTEKTLVEAIQSSLEQMSKTGVMENELASRLISIGQINAEVLNDGQARSRLLYFDGRRLFGRSAYEQAFSRFREAEEIWPGSAVAKSRELAEVRLRIAICQRHLGDRAGARETVMRALRLRGGVDWELFQSVVANEGAFEMYENRAVARRLWSKGLRVARHAGNVDSVAHFTNDLAHLALMDRNYGEAIRLVNDAMSVAEQHGVVKEEIRCEIFRGSVYMATNREQLAAHAFRQAEERAVVHTNLRRLWRIRANLATLSELDEQWRDAFVRDRQAIQHMPIENELSQITQPGGRRTRVTGAMINLILRFWRRPELYSELQNVLGQAAWGYAEALALRLSANGEEPHEVVGGIAALYQPVGQGNLKRFLITE